MFQVSMMIYLNINIQRQQQHRLLGQDDQLPTIRYQLQINILLDTHQPLSTLVCIIRHAIAVEMGFKQTIPIAIPTESM
jgi:hypothetical protein